ncbi:MAG: hypothetical protein J0I31_19725 [Rhizobiales bacterium]|nr:hypothetical protein [Hyphomicrobiales bacterium]
MGLVFSSCQSGQLFLVGQFGNDNLSFSGLPLTSSAAPIAGLAEKSVGLKSSVAVDRMRSDPPLLSIRDVEAAT